MSVSARNTAARRRRLLVPIALGVTVLLGAVVLSLFVRDFVRQVIVLPVTYIAWLIDLVIRSIPQSAFWAVAVAVGILTAWRTLAARRAALTSTVPILAEQSDRSVFLSRLDYIVRMRESPFAREKLAFELRLLIIKLLVYRERLSESEIERQICTGEMVTPPEVHALLTDWQTWLNRPRVTLPRQMLDRLWGRLRRMPDKVVQPDAALERRLECAIDYMETLMSGSAKGSLPEEQHE